MLSNSTAHTTSNIVRLILAQPDIKPPDILYLMSLKGITQSQVAIACNSSTAAVCQVIHGKRRSFDIATYIAAQLNTTLCKLWGEAYNYTPHKRKEVANG